MIAVSTGDLVAVVTVPASLYGLYRWSRPKSLPPRIEWPRAVDYDLASGKWTHPKASA